MNVELLEQIKVRILAEPDAFRMDTWSCGTAHCIAGWALKLCGNPIVNPEASVWTQKTTTGQEPARAAWALLKMERPYVDSDELFMTDDWPSPFREDYQHAESRSDRARIAAERIDHFIATRGE